MLTSTPFSTGADSFSAYSTIGITDFNTDPELQSRSKTSRNVARALDAGTDLPDTAASRNIVHRLDPTLVMDSVNRAVAAIRRNQEQWLARDKAAQAEHDADVAANRKPPRYAPPKAKEREVYANYRISLETRFYARVQVVQLGGAADKFVLIYGATDPATALTGTGPFKTLEEAASWFYRGGR